MPVKARKSLLLRSFFLAEGLKVAKSRFYWFWGVREGACESSSVGLFWRLDDTAPVDSQVPYDGRL